MKEFLFFFFSLNKYSALNDYRLVSGQSSELPRMFKKKTSRRVKNSSHANHVFKSNKRVKGRDAFNSFILYTWL